jgi:hypothetical protein
VTQGGAIARDAGGAAAVGALRGEANQEIGVPRAVLLLVVREKLVDEVLRLYAGPATRKLAALAPESVEAVLAILEDRCQSS